MSPYPDQMSQLGAPSYSSPPFMGMAFNLWNTTLHIQPDLVLNQFPTSQPALVTPQVSSFQPMQSMPQPTQFLSQVSQHVQDAPQTQPILLISRISQLPPSQPLQGVLQTPPLG